MYVLCAKQMGCFSLRVVTLVVDKRVCLSYCR